MYWKCCTEEEERTEEKGGGTRKDHRSHAHEEEEAWPLQWNERRRGHEERTAGPCTRKPRHPHCKSSSIKSTLSSEFAAFILREVDLLSYIYKTLVDSV